MGRNRSISFLLAAAILALPTAAYAQEGGQVVSGDATITQTDPLTTVINQLTGKAIINWDSFGVASGALVQFNQPTGGVILNRVIGSDPSSILGSLQANGTVFLLNPNGILFGAGSTVDVGGLVASTLTITDSDFLAGNYRLTQDPQKALSYVVNQGSINAGDYAALVAPLVENSGSITSLGGTVYLLGASEAVLHIQGSELIGYSIGNVTGGTIHIHSGALSDPVRAVVNFAGLIEAGAVIDDGSGMVQLVGAEGLVVNTGSVTVSGFDTTSAGRIALDSSQATATLSTSVLEANGTGPGADAGTITILSRRNTYFNGRAQADALSTGAGGFIEVSAPNTLYFFGNPSAVSADGPGGTLLIDPTTLTITNGVTPGTQDTAALDGVILSGDPNNGANTLSEVALEALVGAMNVVIQATDSITFNDLGDNALSMKALTGFSVTFQTTNTFASGGITMSGTTDSINTVGGAINITSATYMNMRNFNSSGGAVTLTANSYVYAGSITASGSTINIRADADSNASGAVYQWAGSMWTATNVILRAANGITSSSGGTSYLNTTATNLQIVNGVAPYTSQGGTYGYISVYNNLPTTFSDLLGLGFAVRNNSQSGYNTYLYSWGNMTLNGSIRCPYYSNTIYLYAYNNGSILDDGLQTTFIETPYRIYMYAQSGGIGGVGSGLTYFNPFVDVQMVSGYTTYVYAYTAGNIYISYVNYAPQVYTSYLGGTWNPTNTGAQVHLANLAGDLYSNTTFFTGSNDSLYLYCTGNFYQTSSITLGSTSVPNLEIHADGGITISTGTINAGTARRFFADSNAAAVAGIAFTGNPFIAADGTGSYSQSGGTLGGTGSLHINSSGGISVTGGAVNVPTLKVENRGTGGITWTDTGTASITLSNLGSGNAISNAGTGAISFVHSGYITVASSITAPGTTTLTLQSTGGAISQTGGTLTATSLVLRSAYGVSVNGIAVTNLQVQVSTSGSISVTTTGNLTLTDIAGLGYAVSNTSNSTAITTTGALTIASSVTCTGQLALLQTTGGTLSQTGGTITATTLLLWGSTGISAPTVTVTSLYCNNTTSGNITVTTAGSMSLLDILNTGGGVITLTAGVNITDDGNQLTRIVNAGGTINLVATTGSIGTFGGSNFNGFVDVEPGFGALNATAVTNVFISQVGVGALSSSQLGNFDATGSGGTQGLVNLGGDLTINDTEFSGLDDAILLGASGNLTFGSAVSTTSTITGHADGTVTISANLTASSTISLFADSTFFGLADGIGNINRTAGTITAPSLSLDASSGITIAGGGAVGTLDAINRTSGVITFGNTGDLTILNVSNAAGGAITLTSTGSLLDDGLQTTAITGTGTINLTAGGSIGASGGGNFDQYLDITGGFGTLNATAGTNLFITIVGAGNVASSQLGTFDVTAVGGTQSLVNLVGDLTVNDAEFLGLNDVLLLGASGNLTVSSAMSTTAGTITLLADGNLSLGANITAGTTIDLQADAPAFGSDGTGLINQTAGTLTATNVTALASQGITLNGLAVTNLTATNTTSGTVTISTAGALTLADLGSGYAILNSAGGVSVTAAGNLTVASSVTANGPVSLASTAGAITQTGGTVSGGALTLDSATGMTLNSLSVASAVATNSGAGDLSLSFNGATALGMISNPGGNVSLSMNGSLTLGAGVTAGGSVSLNVTGVLTQTGTGDITAGGAATIITGGNYNIGLVTAGGDVLIQAGGSILDTNGGALNATSPGNGQLTAGGTIGTDADPIEIQFGGVVSVGAGGSVGGVSINMSGTTGNNDLFILFSPPNGLVKWNGIIRLVSLESTFGSMDWFLDVQRRKYDPRLHEPLDEESTTEEELLKRRAKRLSRVR